MELGCSLRVFGPKCPETRALATIRDIGFLAVELDWKTLAQVRPSLIEVGLKIAGVFIGAITADNSAELRKQVKALTKIITEVQVLGGRLVIVESGPRTHDNFDYLREGLVLLGEEAERLSMDIAVANRVGTRVENRDDLAGLSWRKLPERVGVCIDAFEFHAAAVNPGDVIRETAGRIRLVRLADQLAGIPVVPGQGEVNTEGLIRTLRMVGYGGVIVVDHLSAGNEPIERVLERAYKYYREAFR